MKIFKRKSTTRNIISMPKASNSSIQRRKRFSFGNIFKKNNKGVSRRKGNIFKYMYIPIFIGIFLGLAYISVKYIYKLRSNAFGDQDKHIENVLGLESVPSYPNSTFLFTNSQESLTVKDFLSRGNSVYKLSSSTSTEKIENYYLEVMPSNGWELVNSVAIGNAEKIYGQYWIKEGKGLRIYVKNNNVWYENISETEAREALAGRVQEEIERELLISSGEYQKLLPDYQWLLDIPKEYLIKYEATDIRDYKAVSFQKLGSNNIVRLYPIGYSYSKELDNLLDDYCEKISDENNIWRVVNTTVIYFQGRRAIRGSITSSSGDLYVELITNGNDNMVYVLSTSILEDEIYEYILENIKPQEVTND